MRTTIVKAGNTLIVAAFGNAPHKGLKVKKAKILGGSGKVLSIEKSDAGTVILLPKDAPDSIATVIAIEM